MCRDPVLHELTLALLMAILPIYDRVVHYVVGLVGSLYDIACDSYLIVSGWSLVLTIPMTRALCYEYTIRTSFI